MEFKQKHLKNIIYDDYLLDTAFETMMQIVTISRKINIWCPKLDTSSRFVETNSAQYRAIYLGCGGKRGSTIVWFRGTRLKYDGPIMFGWTSLFQKN